MGLQQTILDATVGKFNYAEFIHPLFRDGAQQAAMWGRFMLRNPKQSSDITANNNVAMDTTKLPTNTNLGAEAQRE